MIKIEISTFIGVVLSIWLTVGFLLEYFASKRLVKAKKEINLAKRCCEVCASVYFISTASGFWRCPLCSSINKEK